MTELPARWYTDTPPNTKFRIWSRGNAGEIYPDPITPLSGTSVFLTAGELGYQDAFVEAGTLDADEFDHGTPNNLMASFGGYLYLNMSIARLYGVRCPGMTAEMVDRQYYGELTGIPPYVDEARPGDESPRHTEALGAWIGTFVFGRDDVPELLEQRAEVLHRIAALGDPATASDEHLLDRLHAFDDLYRTMFCWHILVSAAVGFGIGTVAAVCEAIGRPELPMTLIAGVGDVDSAAPAHAMWDLARLIDDDEELTIAFDGGVSDVIERIESLGTPASDRFADALDHFLARFGSRGPNEWELRSRVWGTHPEVALAAVDRMRGMSLDESPAEHAVRRAAEREAATAEVRAMLAGNDEAAGQFEAGLRAAMLFGAARERCKTTLIMVVHDLRRAARELGRRAVWAGHLDHLEQVFMLTDAELRRFVADPAPWRDTVREREAQYLALFELEPPFIVVGEAPPLLEWTRRDQHVAEPVAAGDVLTGIPGCAGIARGRARIITDPSDPLALEPGDVLIAPLTDPAWTPLFVPACAVVVDVGAQITHAVIVSRELGIPCVVSVTDATRRIPDGSIVEVDGGAGTVTVVSLPD